jgi:hypothetical protein
LLEDSNTKTFSFLSLFEQFIIKSSYFSAYKLKLINNANNIITFFIGVGSKETPSNLDAEALAKAGEELDPLLSNILTIFSTFVNKNF